jgi:hypothetical protein
MFRIAIIFTLGVLMMFSQPLAHAANPFITTAYSADPSAHVSMAGCMSILRMIATMRSGMT